MQGPDQIASELRFATEFKSSRISVSDRNQPRLDGSDRGAVGVSLSQRCAQSPAILTVMVRPA